MDNKRLYNSIMKDISNRLNEVLDNEYMLPLKRHMEESDKEKWLANINNGNVTPSSFLAWCANADEYTDGDCPDIKDEYALKLLKRYNRVYFDYDNYDERHETEDKLDAEIYEYIKTNYRKFKKWLKAYHGNNIFTDEHRDQRLWNTNCVFKEMSVFKNKWIIHFRKENVSKNQVIKGRGKSEMKQLGYTYGTMFDENSEDGGYMFGYLADDVHDISNREIVSKSSDGYGTYAIMFKGKGLRMYHASDREYQVIFNAGDMNLHDACLLKFETKGGRYWDEFDQLKISDDTEATVSVIQPFTNKVIYKSKDFGEIIDWIENNYFQYRKQLSFDNRTLDVLSRKIKENPEFGNEILDRFFKSVERSERHASGYKQRELLRMIKLFNKYKDVELRNGETLGDDYEKKFGNEFDNESLIKFFSFHSYDKVLVKDAVRYSEREFELKFPEFKKYRIGN